MNSLPETNPSETIHSASILFPRTLLGLRLAWSVEMDGDQAPGTGLFLALRSLALSAMGS
jgi:hypothetical protein